ncbi:MAG TPA: formyltransferase family protein, partial [Segetibacter sp.]
MQASKHILQKNHSTKQIAIFASGAGSNAKKIIEHFKGNDSIVVKLIVCNKPGAGVIQIAADNNIDVLILERERFFKGDGYVEELHKWSIDFIVLAGFLWKIPETIIENFRNRIINIHPALLPKYGGKGMYGSKVHEAVIASGETESGITIHYVDEHYDNGDIIFQAKC